MFLQLGAARKIGVFSWPLERGAPGFASPECCAILEASIADCVAFRALLSAASASTLDMALSDSPCFTLQLELRNARLVALSACLDGTEGRLSGTIEDVSRHRNELADLTKREELCRAVAENSPAMLWMGDALGKCVFLNQAQRDFWGVDPQDLSLFDWGATLHPDDREKLSGPFSKAMAEHTGFSVEARYRRADGEFRTLRTEARPRFDDVGTFLGMTGVNTDITDRLLAEERTRMLMGELNHRTKNILSVVQAVARQTARNANADSFLKTFDDRLRGLATSNDLLLRNDWSGVTLADMIDAQLGHLRDLFDRRLFFSGPELRISSSAAQPLGMAFHELATNSLKYGALSTDEGRIDLTWHLPDAERPGFVLKWIESQSGEGARPPAAPERKGFGHTVIVDMIAAALDADVEVSFDADGFKWIVTARTNASLIG